MKLHHIGIVVADIAAATPWWRDTLGYRPTTGVVHDPRQKVNVQMFAALDGSSIELIEPADETSPVTRFLAERGGGLYHICYEVEDIEAAVAQWRQAGAFPAKRMEPAEAFQGRRVVFFIAPNRMLFELVEAEPAR